MTTSFRNFLFEQESVTTYPSIDSFAEAIKKNCSEFLEINKTLIEQGHYMFRGFTSLNKIRNMFFSYAPRKDRKPLTSSKIVHELYDEYFLQKFDYRYRSQSAFCTLSRIAANNFASDSGMFVVFPKNGYKMVASNHVEDLFTMSSAPAELFKKLDNSIGDFLDAKTEPEHDEAKQKVFNVMDKLQYFETKSLTDITFKPAEILVQTDAIYAIAHSSSKAGYFFSETGEHIRLADLLYK